MTEVMAALRKLRAHREREVLKRGWAEVSPWIFCTSAGTPVSANDSLCDAGDMPRALASATSPPCPAPDCHVRVVIARTRRAVHAHAEFHFSRRSRS